MGPVLALVAFVVLLFGVGGIYLFGKGMALYYRCLCCVCFSPLEEEEEEEEEKGRSQERK